jgi:phosphoglycerol transferase
MDKLSVVNGFALFVATYAGFGVAIGAVVPQIRVYARMFVYVAFFSFAALALLLDRLGDRPRRTRRGAALFAAGLTGLLVVGLLDQVSPGILPDYGASATRWRSDAEITARIEKALPAGSMVFTLPYMPFPESPIPYPGTMNDYDHMRGYMHSSTLRWSYGAMKGRSTDLWQRAVAGADAAEMIIELRAKGFDGIWLNRDGYADRGEDLVRRLQKELRVEPLSSPDRSIVFFRL